MRVLVACEFSGIVREAFKKTGHDAWSCDLLPTKIPGNHIVGNVLDVLDNGWDLMIAHPPCTYLSRAGARWWGDISRQQLANDAANFVFKLRDAKINKIAIENPIGQLNKRWRYPDQTIHPYMFGSPFSKATCLWLKNLPKLIATNIITDYTPLIRSNVTGRNKKQQKQTGKYSGGIITAITFQGIADAMAEQWSTLNPCSLNNEQSELVDSKDMSPEDYAFMRSFKRKKQESNLTQAQKDYDSYVTRIRDHGYDEDEI